MLASMFGTMGGMALFAGFVAAVIYFALQSAEQWKKRLGAAGKELGLDLTEGGWWSTPSLTGLVGDHPVVVDTFSRSHGKSSTLYSRIRVTSHQPLHLRSESFLGSLGILGADVATGDAAFDAAVRVVGLPIAVSSLLDVETRARARSELTAGTTVSEGELYFERRGHFDNATQIVDRVQRMVALAELLERPVGLPALRRVARTDEAEGVRERAAERLLDSLAKQGRPDVHLLDALSTELSGAMSNARLAALRGDRDALRRFLGHDDPRVAQLAALTLARGAAPGAEADVEAALIELLPSGSLQVIELLGTIGTIGAVKPLHVLADRTFVVDGSATAARDAIRAIQARAPGGERGGLALVEATGGGVSLAASHAGELAEVSTARAPTRQRTTE